MTINSSIDNARSDVSNEWRARGRFPVGRKRKKNEKSAFFVLIHLRTKKCPLNETEAQRHPFKNLPRCVPAIQFIFQIDALITRQPLQ